jgi:caspase domain-containing protein
LNPTISITEAQTNDDRGLRFSEGAVNAWPRKAKRFAMVIGVDEYQDTQISKLDGASNDAKSLANALIENGGFPADQVILFTSDQPPERRPTRGNILRRLSNLQTIVPKDGLLLVSFSGHGMERDRRAYLLPTDAQVNGDLALLEETAINADVIRNWIHQTGIGQVVMIIDACRNNPSGGRGDASKPLTEAYTRGFNFDVRNREISAFATLYATEIGQVAYEFKEKKQGYFTWALVEGLKGGAANEQGEITLAGLVKYLQESVPKRVQLDLGGDKNQRPFAIVEGYKADDLVISVAVKVPTATGSTAKPSDPVDSTVIELSFWDTIKNSSNPEDFKDYLQQYPNGRFATLARRRANPTASNQPPSATGPSVGSGASSPDPNAIATKDIGPLRVVLKSAMRVKARDQWGNSSNGIRCSFEFINSETQRPLIVAMNAMASTNAVGDYLRSTLVDENGGNWRLRSSDVAGMSIISVGFQYWSGPLFNPAQIVTVLSKRDDLNSDVTIDRRTSEWEYHFIFGSTTEMSPGQSLSVTMTFVEDANPTTSGAPPKVFQMATEIVVGVGSGTKKSYTLHNLTLDRVSLPGRSS